MKIKDRFPVSAWKTADGWESTGLAYEDYTRFATHTHKESGERRLPTPVWALNNNQFAEVLVTFMEERSGMRTKQRGPLLERLARAQARIHEVVLPSYRKQLVDLCKRFTRYQQHGRYGEWTEEQVREEYTRKFNKDALPFTDTVLAPRFRMESQNIEKISILIENRDTFIRESNNPTAGAGIIARVVYLYYRAGLDSVGVGQELGLKPPHVRQILWRLADTGARVSQCAESEAAASAEPGKTAEAEKAIDAPLFALIDSVNRASESLQELGEAMQEATQSAEQFTEAASQVQDDVLKARIAELDAATHGLRATYRKLGCRCAECKAANAAYEKARYARAKAAPATGA